MAVVFVYFEYSLCDILRVVDCVCMLMNRQQQKVFYLCHTPHMPVYLAFTAAEISLHEHDKTDALGCRDKNSLLENLHFMSNSQLVGLL